MSKQLYFFCGDETHLIEEAVKITQRQYASATVMQYSDQFDLSLLRDAVSMTTLFGGSQLLLVKNPWFLSKSLSDKELSVLEQVLALLPQTDHVMVVYLFGTVDQRKKIISLLKKHSNFQMFSPFKEWEQDKVMAWISQEVAKYNKKIDQDAVIILEQIGGTNLQILSNEINTLCLYVGERPHITANDVKAMSADISTNTFALLEALKKGQHTTVVQLTTQLLRHGEDPIKLLGLITSNIRLFIQLLQLHKQNLPNAAIAKTLGKNPYYINRLLPTVKQYYTLQSASEKLIRLATADFEIKSGKKPFTEALTISLL